MTQEGNAFAALLGNLEQRLQVDGEKRYFAFPPFVLGLQPDELIFDANALPDGSAETPDKGQSKVGINQENFSMLVNQIPPVNATYLTDGRMLWDVYERIINTADLPLDELGDDQKVLDITEEFSKYRGDFRLAERGPASADGSGYYVTSILPPGQNITWSKILLNKSKFNEAGAGISKGVQGWLSEAGLLDEPLGSGISIESLSAEVFPVEVRRSWLNPRVFQSRSWKWDDPTLSDGGNPPQGILPAYVVGVVFARNLVIALDTEAAASSPSSSARTLPVPNR